jgi:hypothetical protein
MSSGNDNDLINMARMALFGDVRHAGFCVFCGAETMNSSVCSLHEKQVYEHLLSDRKILVYFIKREALTRFVTLVNSGTLR